MGNTKLATDLLDGVWVCGDYVYRDDGTGRWYAVEAGEVDDLGDALARGDDDAYSLWCAATDVRECDDPSGVDDATLRAFGRFVDDAVSALRWATRGWAPEQARAWRAAGWGARAANEAVDVHGADPDSPPLGDQVSWLTAKQSGESFEDWTRECEAIAAGRAKWEEACKRHLARGPR